MMLVHAYLAPSKIEGLGVFSNTDIAKGDPVWRFDPRIDQLFPRALLDEVDELTRNFLWRYGYEIPTRPDFIALDADECRFLNHCDTPNLDFTIPELATARIDIPAGTELTCDYREFMTGDLYFQSSKDDAVPNAYTLA